MPELRGDTERTYTSHGIAESKLNWQRPGASQSLSRQNNRRLMNQIVFVDRWQQHNSMSGVFDHWDFRTDPLLDARLYVIILFGE